MSDDSEQVTTLIKRAADRTAAFGCLSGSPFCWDLAARRGLGSARAFQTCFEKGRVPQCLLIPSGKQEICRIWRPAGSQRSPTAVSKQTSEAATLPPGRAA